jgi:ABC-type nitrate/sulfonate/bicarbonate transport system substrate-binding protein
VALKLTVTAPIAAGILLAACGSAAGAPAPSGAAASSGSSAAGASSASTAAGSQPAAATGGNPYLPAPGEKPIPVKAAWCAVSAGFVQLFVARDANIFSKYGLNVDVNLINSSKANIAALQNGEIDFDYCAASGNVGAFASGIDGKLVGSPLKGMAYVMIASKDVHSPADLKGKSVAISQAGDVTDQYIHALFKKEGVPADTVQFTPVGGQTDRYTALLAGRVSATIIEPPLDVQAQRDGLNVIYHLRDLGIPYIEASISTPTKFIKQNPTAVQRFVAALSEATIYSRQHKDVTERSISKELKTTDRAALDSAWDTYANQMVNRDMQVPMQAVQDAIDLARSQGTPIVINTASGIVDSSFASKLTSSGFLNAVWGPASSTSPGASE